MMSYLHTDGEELIIGNNAPRTLAAVNALFYHPDDARYKHLAGKMANTSLIIEH